MEHLVCDGQSLQHPLVKTCFRYRPRPDLFLRERGYGLAEPPRLQTHADAEDALRLSFGLHKLMPHEPDGVGSSLQTCS